jgi:hypothetical protein
MGIPCNWEMIHTESSDPRFVWKYVDKEFPGFWFDDESKNPQPKNWYEDPSEKRGTFEMSLPEGTVVLSREFIGLPGDHEFSVSMRLKLSQPDALPDSANIEVRVVPKLASSEHGYLVSLLDPASEESTSRATTVFRTNAAKHSHSNWHLISGPAEGGEPISIQPGEEGLTVIVIARDMGECTLSFDWLTLDMHSVE